LIYPEGVSSGKTGRVNRPGSLKDSRGGRKFMRTQTIDSRPRAGSETSSRSEALVAAVLAALLGSFLIWGVGFSHIDVLHNAAHDTRHSAGFPCH
jgi:cobalt transporter subunit CbtB